MRFAFFCLCLPLLSEAQFAPPAGQAGSTAMHKDSSAFVAWAGFCELVRGPQDISNPGGGNATVGDSSVAIGKADNSIVSLGDAGTAVCTFQNAITNGPGADFAVFENSFSDDYLEFAFVEVSSDGVNFFRFPATSNIQDTLQCGSFGLSDATLVNNLAGKYRGMYGTPFDLTELQGTAGLNINAVTHVKVIDVIGSLNTAYATYDMNNNRINDPWPTAFPSSGFDLDAVGVIHDVTNSIVVYSGPGLVVFPNPVHTGQNVELRIQKAELESEICVLSDLSGREVGKSINENGRSYLKTDGLLPGMYLVRAGSYVVKIIVN